MKGENSLFVPSENPDGKSRASTITYSNVTWNQIKTLLFQDYNGSVESAQCELADPLIQSAISRVKSEECKKSLIDVYCFHSDNYEELDNTCPQFGKLSF